MNPETFLALGEPNRFRIVELLRTGPRPVNDIGGRLGLRQSQVSQHLKVLKDVGLVIDHPAGNRRIYRLDPDGLAMLREYLDLFWQRSLAAFKEAVEQHDEETS